MAQAGLHTYVSILLKNKIPNKQWFFYSFLFASILPEIDIVLSILHKFIYDTSYNFIFSTSLFHSIITNTIVYIIILTAYEIKKKSYLLHVANGYALGIIIHLSLDILIWFRPINILWPLPTTPVDIWANVGIPLELITLHTLLEIFFFRLFAFHMINIILLNTKSNNSLIKFLSLWMKGNFYILLTYVILAYKLNLSNLFIAFAIIYIPSLLLMFFILIKLKKHINNYATIKKQNNLNFSIDRKSTIDNIG